MISAIHDELGNLVGYSKVTRDLTERKRAEEEAAARKAAEQANRTKDEFLAMLGHELRNPLAPIVSAIQLLKLRGDKKSAREHPAIERQVKQMVRLVDDLLDVSRISRGKVELKRTPFDLRDALAKATEIALPSIEQKRHDFEVKVPSHPLIVDGDDARLTQVFANLLNNAAKYTNDGGRIVLTVRHSTTHVVVEVQDSGIGVDPALLPRVFDLFVQGYQDAGRAEGGLGIGLTLVRSLVLLHGGEVEARSAGLNEGSTFVVRLPSSDEPLDLEPEPEPSVPIPAAPSKRRQILLVDDNEDARMLLADVLATFGHKVKSAADGPAALAIRTLTRRRCAAAGAGRRALDQVEIEAGVPGTPRVLWLPVAGEREQPELLVAGHVPDPRRQLVAVHPREPDVEDRHVRLEHLEDPEPGSPASASRRQRLLRRTTSPLHGAERMAGFVGDRMPHGRPGCFTQRGAAFRRVSMWAVSATCVVKPTSLNSGSDPINHEPERSMGSRVRAVENGRGLGTATESTRPAGDLSRSSLEHSSTRRFERHATLVANRIYLEASTSVIDQILVMPSSGVTPDQRFHRQLFLPNQLTHRVSMTINDAWHERSRSERGTFSSSCSGAAASDVAPGASPRARVRESGTRRGRSSNRTTRCTS